jgi:hypothetical protein
MTPSVSIVAEWETVLAAGRERGVQCLASINRQLWALTDGSGARSEIIVCLDASEVSESSVGDALEEAHEGRGWPVQPVIAAAPRDYYQKKNYGFALSTGDVVVFVDSDLIPEADWLSNLLAAFADFRKSVVVGRTHMETRTIYERGVALFWIFDTRDPSSAVRPTRRLVSNNIAFRRPVLAHFPFPDRPTFRGQCSELASMLAARGIPLHEHPAARASHPPPQGPRQFLMRAFRAGSDQRFYDALDRTASVSQCARQWWMDLENVVERIQRRRREIDAGLPSVIVALTLGLVYYSTKAAGYVARVLQHAPGSSPSLQPTRR